MFSTSRDWKLYVKDINKQISLIKLFTKDITYEEFTNNIEKVYAVAKALENIGEAVKQIPKDIQKNYQSIPWREIAKMRDILTHHYFGVDDKILWNSLGKDLEKLDGVIVDIMKEYNI